RQHLARQALSIVSSNAGAQYRTGSGSQRKPHFGEVTRTPHATALHENFHLGTGLGIEIARKRGGTLRAQFGGPLLDHAAIDLRHTRRGRAGAAGEWKHMQVRETAIVDDAYGVGEH